MHLHFVSRCTQSTRILITVILCLFMLACGGRSVEEHIAQAQQHIQSGDANTAIIELKAAIQSDPKNAQARFLLGKIYMEMNDYASAEKELTRARDLGYSAADVIPLLSQAFQRNQTVVGLSTIDTSSVKDDAAAQAQVSFYKLQSLVELEQKDEAKALLDEIRVLDTDSVYRDLALVYETIMANDATGAELQLSKIRKEAPANRDLLNILARLYIIQNKRSEALEVMGEYVTQSPDDLETLFTYTGLLIEAGNTEEAKVHADKLIDISPNNPLLNQMYAVILASEDNHKGAFDAAEKSISLGNLNPVARVIAGYSAYKMNDFINANKHLSFIASDLPDNHPGLKMLASSQLELGLSLQASQILARVSPEDSAHSELYSKLGYELIQDGYIDEAKVLIEQTEQTATNNVDLTRIGILKLSVNDLDGILDLEAAAKSAPDDVSTQAILATAYLANRDYDKALQLAGNWQALMPTEAKAYVLEAEAAVATDDLTRAQVALETAEGLAPNDPVVGMSMVRLMVKQQNYTDAFTRVESVLATAPTFEPALLMYYMLGKELDNGKDPIIYLDRAIAEQPTPSMYLLKARVLNSQGKYDEALAVLANHQAVDDDSQQYWISKGQALVASDKVNSAQDHYALWLEAYPNSFDALLGRLVIHDVKNEHTQGLALIKSKPILRKQLPIKVMELNFLTRLGNTNSARKIYNELADNVKALGDIQALNAQLFLLENKPKQAIEPAQIGYKSRNNRRNMVTLFKAYEGANNPADAIKVLNEYVTQKPDDGVAKMLLAERSMQSNPRKAITIYTEIVQQQPSNFVALNNLAHLLYTQDELDKASEYATNAMAIKPDNASVVDTLAQIYIAQEKYQDALALYQRVVSDTMQNEAIFLNYIETLILADNRLLAKRKLESRQWQERNSQQRIDVIKAKYNI